MVKLEQNPDYSARPPVVKETLRNRTAWRFRTAEWRKNFRVTMGMQRRFLVILPFWVFQPSRCVRSPKKRRRQRQRQGQHHKSIIWSVGWGKRIVLHVRHALWCKFVPQSATWQCEILIFEGLMRTRARSGKSFLLCLLHENHLCQSSERSLRLFRTQDERRIIAKHLTQRKILLECDSFVFVTVVVVET